MASLTFFDYSPRGLLTLFFRQKNKFLAVFVVVALAGLLHVMRLPTEYAAQGSLLIKFGPDAVPQVDLSPGGRQDYSDSEQNELIQANLKILRSAAVLEDVVLQVGLATLYPDLAPTGKKPDLTRLTRQATARLSSQINVRNDNRSNVIEVSVRHPDAALSATATTALMERFIARQLEIYNSPQTNFLQDQILEARRAMNQAQLDLQIFKQDNGLSDLSEEMEQLLAEKGSIAGIAYRAVTDAQERLADLEAKQAEALSTYNETSPIITRLDDMIAAAQGEIQKRQEDLAAVQIDGPLYARLGKIDERIDYLESQRSRYDELSQRVAIAAESHKYYQQRGEEARVNDLLNQRNISRVVILEPAATPLYPVPQHKKLLLIAFLMLGAFLGLAVTLAAEFLDSRVAYPQDLTAGLGLPLITSIWEHETNQRRIA